MDKKLASGIFLLGVLLLLAALLVGCATPATEQAPPTEPPPTSVPQEAPTDVPTEPPEAPTAAPTEPPEPELSGDLVRGGLLYDKWWTVAEVDEPVGDQPLWATQTTNERSGTDTWRCKECHGWDYKGADGAYGSGSHFTGFPGVFASAGKPPVEILEALKGSTSPDHNFSAVMDDQALTDLSLFITGGLVDTGDLVDDDKVAKGNAAQGEGNYDEVCAPCHGPEGIAINFHGFDEPEYVTTIALDNPWEFIHKVRFGQPGWPMPSAIVNDWTNEDVANVLAYVQTLPADATLNLGGQLYDKWWTVAEVDEPVGDQPLWATQTTNERSGTDTWRCKECHGWDYKGADGAYGSGSHFTGFAGVLGSGSMSEADLTAWLNGETNPDHDFSAMGDLAISALVQFMSEEISDVGGFINEDNSVSGDPALGKEMFDNTCASCHGTDGKRINFHDPDEPEYVGTIARDNPWEFFHKGYFGQPGTPMPAGLGLGWSLEDIANVAAFAQTLPTD